MSDRLSEIKARLDAATPGPWEYGGHMRWSKTNKDVRLVWTVNPHHIQIDTAWIPAINQDANGGFIANAPADIAYLLGEVERLTAERDALRETTMTASANARRFANMAAICEAALRRIVDIEDGTVFCGPQTMGDIALAALRQVRGEERS